MFLRHLPWQIQVLILIVTVLLLIPHIIKMSKRAPKLITIGFIGLTATGIILMVIRLGENVGENVGITPKHVDILSYIMAVLLVLSVTLIGIGGYQVEQDEKKRKNMLKIVWGFIICVILFIILILL